MLTKIRNLIIVFFLFPCFAWGTEELQGYLLDQYEGAVCNSGSPASYYLKKQDPKKWVLYMEPGGGASSDESYRKRPRHLKNSLLKDIGQKTFKAYNIFDSFIGNNYSTIYLPYCSSDVFSGSHTREIDGKKVFFHGKIIFESILKEFENEFQNADDLIIGGSSAGSISVGMNLKKIADLNNPNIRFVHDGYWLDETEIEPRKKMSKAKGVLYGFPKMPSDCIDWSDCYPSKKRLSKYNFNDAFIVWTVDDHFRRSENDDLMMKSIKEDINYFGGGVSFFRETPLLMGRRKSNHVLLFQPSFYQEVNGVKIKDIFDNWLNKTNGQKILINF